ncbi:glycerophosphocholine cholinephosphodiesterase ENPP6-like [Daphnia pulex]|uniref:glycerophosphocholine cholinephosphodiesterase ENPP6-like n=1 Tax=Daphnia pulex TaxID=6669 RepID=UPI001EDF0D18|nr:glycerophosphocholine cholinephosphodiesterase ENPP6-like [Daphnia pulex]XP_046449995.1 glycerophosphocholine cholinephosphodiesterase ENPP6-like [Daphnia pulex]XP_046449996.1 glycerophosphocholine cholinephosphodiesterase ENPP6-like [Daphnia pulex]XP_046449998.1 glycerophosphocholine cholinephosphodiesterase ENPP6-like [Daphnia pulex]XP_046449999.1 glycerophosphocholine cholinephosphodiesterase ENPP6-like [Daphnia pulex]XP_046642438.1 glycerophosphocholine cholinephosphodiesterase ENPP6-li
MQRTLWYALAILCCSIANSLGAPDKPKQQPAAAHKEKLVVILLDGFRWDYVEQQKEKESLPGFRILHKEGVRAKWVNPIFPSLSYASWTTLSTGLYAENHNIIGNYFHDSYRKETFELFNRTLTSNQRWWQDAEPIWTTATRRGRKVGTFLWARSDIPVQGILPHQAQGFQLTKGAGILGTNLEKTIKMLQSEDYDLVMVYNEHIDNKGHQFGPTSPELMLAVQEVDAELHKFLKKLEETNLDETVNVMIVSDHGMTSGTPQSKAEYVEIDDYLNMDDVSYVIDRAAVAAVAPLPGKADKVYKQLKHMRGIDVYRRDDIPEEYHYKNGRYVQEILVCAKPGFIISGADSSKQIPRDPSTPRPMIWGGLHGYDDKHPDMRTIFMAKGPSFKKHFKGEPIHLVDIYQIYAHILGFEPQPHNGSWSRVRSYLTNSASFTKVLNLNPILLTALLILLRYLI